MADVLLTGATGFIGGEIATQLLRRGDEVRAVVRGRADDLAAAGAQLFPGGLEAVDPAAFSGVDAVVHVAASFSGELAEARAVNRDGTRRMVQLALEAGVPRFVHASTTAVYDLAALGDVVVDESAPLRRDTTRPGVSGSSPPTYGVTKAEAEDEVIAARRAGLSAAILRPPAVLGAGPTSTWGTRVPRQLLAGEEFARHPEATFAWIHVADFATAILAALDTEGQVTANAVAGHETVGDYLRRVLAALPGEVTPPQADTAPWRGSYARERLAEDLGVTPRRSFDEAMDEIQNALREWSGDERGEV